MIGSEAPLSLASLWESRSLREALLQDRLGRGWLGTSPVCLLYSGPYPGASFCRNFQEENQYRDGGQGWRASEGLEVSWRPLSLATPEWERGGKEGLERGVVIPRGVTVEERKA